MANITPRAEGIVPVADYAKVRAALVTLLGPVLDGKVDTADAITMATAALLEVVPSIRGLPDGSVVKVAGTALASIAAEVLEDLVVVYPDEVIGAPVTGEALAHGNPNDAPPQDPHDMRQA